MNNNQQKGLSIILVLLLLPIWEAIRIFANISPMLMPALHQIGESLLHDLIHGELLLNILTSFCYIFLGISIACVFCLLSLVLSHKCPILKESIQLLAAIFHPLPGIALLPIIILWAGIGAKAITLIILHSVFWPMLTNLQTGIAAIPRNWKMIAENYAIRSTPYLLSIAIPAASPHLIAGLKIAWSRAWRALITAEMLFGAVSGAGGLGWYIQSKRVFMDTAGLFAGIIAIMISGSLVEYFLFSALEKRTIKKWGMHT